jgi:FkbM family methyltransferase
VFDRDYKILSLEPNRLLEPALAKIAHKDPLFQYRILGAGSHQDRLTFFVPVYRGVVLHTFTSSNREQVLNAIESSFGKKVARKIRIERVDCDVVPIDHLEVDPSIIKIDAEGLDYEVLLGASATISRTRPFVVVEVGWASLDKVLAFFRNNDYTPLVYDLGADLFRRDIAGYIKAESGYRNLFAVPNEVVANLPIEPDLP